MRTFDPRRVLGEGLTKAAEALAVGSDELHLRDAAEHLAHALGATSVAILAVQGAAGSETPYVIADSDERRTETHWAEILVSTPVRESLSTGDVVVAAELFTPIVSEAKSPRQPGTSAPAPAGSWVVFPIMVKRQTRGVLAARLPVSESDLDEEVFECGRAAAALLAVVLPAAKLQESRLERTRRITLTDVHRERRLRAIERYRAFIDSASDGMVVVDAAGLVLYVNRAAEQATGYAREGLIGKPWADVVLEADRPALYLQVRSAMQSQMVENFDLKLVTTSGDRMTVSVASIGILAEHGAAIFAFRDVTVARALESELRRTTEFLERILNSAVDGIIAADLRGTILLFNHGAERICGYRAADLIGKVSVTELYPGGVAQEIMRLLRSSERGRAGQLEPVRRDLIAASGERIPVSISAALVVDDSGHDIATVGIFSDLRDRLRMEERLATAQEKLAISEKQVVAIELAGAAAHELNQPLTSVMGYAQMLLRKIEKDSPHHRVLETILTESERMAAIVRQLGSLTRYETKTYVGGAQIIDLDRSAPKKDDEG